MYLVDLKVCKKYKLLVKLATDLKIVLAPPTLQTSRAPANIPNFGQSNLTLRYIDVLVAFRCVSGLESVNNILSYTFSHVPPAVRRGVVRLYDEHKIFQMRLT